jgi:hypothetical protein
MVISGDNDSVKSSLIDALGKVLLPTANGLPQFEPQHFYRDSLAHQEIRWGIYNLN